MVKGRTGSILVVVAIGVALWLLFSGGGRGLTARDTPAPRVTASAQPTGTARAPGSRPSPATSARSLWSIVDGARDKREAAQPSAQSTARAAGRDTDTGRRSIFNPDGTPAPASARAPSAPRTYTLAPSLRGGQRDGSTAARPPSTPRPNATTSPRSSRTPSSAARAAQPPLAAESAVRSPSSPARVQAAPGESVSSRATGGVSSATMLANGVSAAAGLAFLVVAILLGRR